MAVIADAWNMHGDVGTGGWVLMVIAMILFWGAIIGLVIWLVRGGAAPRAPAPEDPRTLLDRRLASGELTPEEYEQRRALLDRSKSGT